MEKSSSNDFFRKSNNEGHDNPSQEKRSNRFDFFSLGSISMIGENIDLQSIVHAVESEANEDYPMKGRYSRQQTPRQSFHEIEPVYIMEARSPRSDLADDEYPSNHSVTMSHHSIPSRDKSFESPIDPKEMKDRDQEMKEESKSLGNSNESFSYPSPPIQQTKRRGEK